MKIKFSYDSLPLVNESRQIIKKVVHILRIGWSIDTNADQFIFGKS